MKIIRFVSDGFSGYRREPAGDGRSGQYVPAGVARAMLAALQRMVRNAECTCADGGPGFQCDVCEARSAIAKATGEDQP